MTTRTESYVGHDVLMRSVQYMEDSGWAVRQIVIRGGYAIVVYERETT